MSIKKLFLIATLTVTVLASNALQMVAHCVGGSQDKPGIAYADSGTGSDDRGTGQPDDPTIRPGIGQRTE